MATSDVNVSTADGPMRLHEAKPDFFRRTGPGAVADYRNFEKSFLIALHYAIGASVGVYGAGIIG
jgi:hypothetical protein